MVNNAKVIYLKHNEINYIRWDKCISSSMNGIVYAFSWYLDIVNLEWEALIYGEYEAVMPLTRGRKHGIPYLYQPPFTQQLGVFSMKALNDELIEKFLNAIPDKYRYIEINLNTFNTIANKSFQKKVNITYQLDLIEPYHKLFQNFSNNTRRNLSKALNNNLSITKGMKTNELVDFYKKEVGESILKLKEEHYQILQRIVSVTVQNKIGEVYAVYNQDNVLCAAALFLSTHKKSIFLLSVCSEEGKEKGAMFHLINFYISKFAEKHITLDFEGSNQEGIARFYGGFGAKPFQYLQVKRNRLPWLLRLFKK